MSIVSILVTAFDHVVLLKSPIGADHKSGFPSPSGTTPWTEEVEQRKEQLPRGSGRGGQTLVQPFAKQLRCQATDAEQLLWRYLRARRLDGYKFRRQVVIEPYIVDFACFESKLIIEADGGQHEEQRDHDHARTTFLQTRGYRVLRFWNHEILTETQAVLERIHRELMQSPLGFGILRRPTFCVHAVDPNPSPGGTTPWTGEVERSSEPESRGA